MKISYIDTFIASIVLLIAISSVLCNEKEKLRVPESQRLSSGLSGMESNKVRNKRRIEDVEKLIIEDELMSFLICDMCQKNSCSPKYCKFCKQCDVNSINDILMENENSLHKCPDCNKEAYMKLNEILD